MSRMRPGATCEGGLVRGRGGVVELVERGEDEG